MSSRAYALYLSYSYWLKGEPLPVDAFNYITQMGEDPCELEEEWKSGSVPDGENIDDGRNGEDNDPIRP